MRGALPGRLLDPLRRLGRGLLAPLVFSAASGHFRSALLGRAVDARGRPLPWYTYPAISALGSASFAGRRILEFGAGQSTLWWASRASEVVSLEDDPSWHARLASRVPANVALHRVPGDLGPPAERVLTGSFDVVVVDGCDRLRAVELSLPRIAADGGLVLDNAEGNWGAPGTFPILDLLTSRGFCRVDFVGLAPGVWRPHATSVFFRESCFLFRPTGPPRVRVEG